MIFLLAGIWDAITDIAMGWINERVRTRWGRYRPWLLFAAVPFGASFATLFYRPQLGSAADLFLWALVVHLIFRTCYTAVYMPYTAMIARLSTNGPERAAIAGVKNVFSAGAALTISFVVFDLIEWLGGGSEAQGGEARGFMLAALLPLQPCGYASLPRASPRKRRPRSGVTSVVSVPAEMISQLCSATAPSGWCSLR
jgi:GPH family glycoside/pentoside/hexuronide:cation symporter